MIDSFDRIRLADAAPSGSEPSESVQTLEALLVDIDERAGYMPIDMKPSENGIAETIRNRPGWFAAVVAFGVVLLFGAVAALTMSQAPDTEPADEVTVTTEALTAEQQVTYDTALTTIDTFNSGDIDAWLKMFRQDGAFWGLQVSGTHVREFVEFRMASGEQLIVDACGPHIDGRRITCKVTIVNDLFTAAGLTSHVGDWIVKSDEKGRVLDIVQAGDLGHEPTELITAMGLWIRDTYPTIWEDVFLAAGDCSLDRDSPNCFNGEWYGTPETGRELLRLVDEFVAQSDMYPLGG